MHSVPSAEEGYVQSEHMLLLPCRQRIPSRNVFYYRSPEHNKNYVLTIAFAFDNEKDVYHFSYCYPYSYSRLQAYLGRLDQMNAAYYRKELLAFSVVRMYAGGAKLLVNDIYLELRVIHVANITSCVWEVRGRHKWMFFLSTRTYVVHTADSITPPSVLLCSNREDWT